MQFNWHFWDDGNDPEIDKRIAENKAAFVTRDGRGDPRHAKVDKDLINRKGRERFLEVAKAQENCTQAERLARRLSERRLRIAG